jgi:hypothetical protein
MKKTMKLQAAIFLLLLGVMLPLHASVNLFGYFENRFYLVESPWISWERFNDKFKLGDYNRMRLKYEVSPSEKVTVNAAVDLFSFHGILTSTMGTYDTSGDTGANGETAASTVKIDLDRAYVDLYLKRCDIRLGKQRVALGVSYLWAPLDIFNRLNILEPKEEKPGANAIRVYVPLGNSAALTGVYSPADDFRSSKSAVRAQVQVMTVDVGLTLMRDGDRQTSIYGLDLRGENILGWWLEAGYFVTPLRKDVKLVLGFDYTFPLKNGLYWLIECYYDASGEKNCADYDYNLLLNGERFTLGQSYFLSMLRYPFTHFFSVSLTALGNWGDGSYMLYPTINWEISQNVMLSTGFYFPLGNSRGEFKQSRPNIFFTWLKISF